MHPRIHRALAWLLLASATASLLCACLATIAPPIVGSLHGTRPQYGPAAIGFIIGAALLAFALDQLEAR